MLGGIIGFLVFSIAVFAGAGFFFVLGIVGAVLFSIQRRKGKSYGLPMMIVSIAVTVLSAAAVAPLVGFYGFLFVLNSTPPEGYVDSVPLIDEVEYQDNRFTVDGVVYESMALSSGDFEISAKDAVFRYEPEPLLSKSQSGNYYRVDNPHGFDIVCDENGSLFCPAEDRAEIYDYYTNESERRYVYSLSSDFDTENGTRRERPISGELEALLLEFESSDSYSGRLISVTAEEEDEITVISYSEDGVVFYDHHYFVRSEGVVHESYSFSAGEYEVWEIDGDLSEALLKLWGDK